jgi:multicomponent Na+:H+ antiporter subunit E
MRVKSVNNPTLSVYAGLSLVLFVLWCLLTGSTESDELLVGAVVAIAAAIATPRTDIFQGFKISLYAPIALARYLIHFIIALLLANLDMARRVLSPSLSLNPEVVEVKTDLQSRFGKLLLANSITLTPGTLTVDVIGDRLLVHWIDSSPGKDLESATLSIAAGFEKHIRGFLQ